MIGIDTNVLVRYLMEDDPQQFRQAAALFSTIEKEGRQAYITSIVLCEVVWVLSRAYKVDSAGIAVALEKILLVTSFDIEDRALVKEALERYRKGKGDFADYMIGVNAHEYRCRTVATFDTALHHDKDLFSPPAAALRANRRN